MLWFLATVLFYCYWHEKDYKRKKCKNTKINYKKNNGNKHILLYGEYVKIDESFEHFKAPHAYIL